MKKIFLKRGFSLVEMLVALIAISCIIAAFAPVMTKKMKTSLSVEGGGWDGILYTFNPDDPVCTKPDGADYVLCDFKVPDKVNSVNAVIVGAGGGGGGGISSGEGRAVESVTDGSTKSITITSAMQDVKIDYLIGGGGGGGTGGAYSDDSELQTMCARYNAYYLAPSGSNTEGYCVTKNPAGSTNGPGVSVTTMMVDKEGFLQSSCNPKTEACCIRDYNNSTVLCNYSGANTICNSINSGWGMVDSRVAQNWFSDGVNGTTLSPWVTTINSMNTPNTCSYISDKCYATEIIAGDYGSRGSNISCNVGGSGGISCSDYKDFSNFYQVYCMSSVGTAKTTYAGGGGGAAGAGIKDIPISDSTIQENVGKQIKLTAGKGGAGYSICSNMGSCYNAVPGLDGGNGTSSSIDIASGILVYTTAGGYGGGGANSTSKSRGGAAHSGSCSYYNGKYFQIINLDCNTYSGSKGYDGTSSTEGTVYSAPGGNGGGSIYGCYGCGGGSGGNYGSASAVGAYYYGAGGGGGGTEVYRSISYGNGAAGASGIAQISYKSPSGYAGSGGSSGARVSLEGLTVIPNKVYKVQVADGGKGGEIGEDAVSRTSGTAIYFEDGNSYFQTTSFGGKKATTSAHGAAPNTNIVNMGLKTSKGNVGFGAGSLSKSFAQQYGLQNASGEHGVNSSAGITVGAVAQGGSGGKTNGTLGGFGCGGLNSSCGNGSSVDGKDAEFKYPGDIVKNHDYGYAGSGGGGGGWSATDGAGKGGKGAPGYVYIYWKRPK